MYLRDMEEKISIEQAEEGVEICFLDYIERQYAEKTRRECSVLHCMRNHKGICKATECSIPKIREKWKN